MNVKPGDPASPTQVATKWRKDPLHPEEEPRPIQFDFRYGFTKWEAAVVKNFIQNYAGKDRKNLHDHVRLCILEIDTLFEVMNEDRTTGPSAKTPYPELKVDLDKDPKIPGP